MISAAERFADLRKRIISQFLGKIHGNLSGIGNGARSLFGIHVLDFYIIVFEYANHYDRASAYFDSKILALYAKGLEKIYENNGKIRFIFSYQLNPDDFEKMQQGYENREIENKLVSAIDIDELTNEVDSAFVITTKKNTTTPNVRMARCNYILNRFIEAFE